LILEKYITTQILK